MQMYILEKVIGMIFGTSINDKVKLLSILLRYATQIVFRKFSCANSYVKKNIFEMYI